MTAPFNPTELARKLAIQDISGAVDGPDLPPTLENAINRRTQHYLRFARDLMRESGAVEALKSCKWHKVKAAHPEYCMKYKEELVKAAIKSLRSITEAERGGAKT
jgi:hypothetical protein